MDYYKMTELEKDFMEGYHIEGIGVSNMDTETALEIAKTALRVLILKIENSGQDEYEQLGRLRDRLEYAHSHFANFIKYRG